MSVKREVVSATGLQTDAVDLLGIRWSANASVLKATYRNAQRAFSGLSLRRQSRPSWYFPPLSLGGLPCHSGPSPEWRTREETMARARKPCFHW